MRITIGWSVNRMWLILICSLLPPSSSLKSSGNSPETDESSLSPDVSNEPKSSPAVRDESSLSFEWTGPRSLRVTNRDGDEDDINLRPSPAIGGIQVECLFTGYLVKDLGSSAGVMGCHHSEQAGIIIVSNYSTGTMFTLFNQNKTLELMETSVEADYGEEPVRQRRSVYYDEYDMYEDDGFEFSGAPIPSNLYYKFQLAYDDAILTKMNKNKTATEDYIKSVATLAQTFFKKASLNTNIHFVINRKIKHLEGKEFQVDPYTNPKGKSTMKDAQALQNEDPLIIFTHTDDSESWRGVAPRRGACSATNARAIVKHRRELQRAALTMAHEMGHLYGNYHDDSKYELPSCVHQGIMTDNITNRQKEWSTCSKDRLKRWYNRQGKHCLETAPECNNMAWNGPCSCGIGVNTNLCTSQDEGYCQSSTATCMVKETKLNTCQSFTSTPGALLESGCEQPQHLENGLFVCLHEGFTCHIHCDPGFKLNTSSPHSYIECIDRRWTQMPSTFRCIPDCAYRRKSHTDCHKDLDEVALIMGGQGTTKKIELWSPSGKCNRELKELPFDGHGMTTNYVNGIILSCGAKFNQKKCYSLNVKTEEWVFHSTMLKSHNYHSSVVINDTTLYIIGGQPETSATTTEYLEPGTKTWKLGPKLPVKEWLFKGKPRFMHYGTCSVQTSPDSFVVHGGGHMSQLTGDEYSFITKQWTKFGNSQEAHRYYHGCATIRSKNVYGILIAGGFPHRKNSFFLNLNENSPAWRKSGYMRFDHVDGKIVKLNNRYFILGGEKSTKVEEYHPENGTWTSGLVDILYTKDQMYGITAVPSKLFSNCN